MTGVASLGMYDHPTQHAANDRLWTAIAQRLAADGVPGVPARLDRTRSVGALWRDPALLFGQICGYPLIREPDLALRILAIPSYAAPGCEADTHCSLLIARRSDRATPLDAFRGRRAAINDRGSNSGMNLFRAAIAPVAGAASFFGSVTETGSHRDSIDAVARGDADLAAIDAVTYAALARFEPELTDAVSVIGRTPASPNLPFVTALATDEATVAALRRALSKALADPDLAEARAALFLTGASAAAIGRFAVLRHIESDAALAGYPELD